MNKETNVEEKKAEAVTEDTEAKETKTSKYRTSKKAGIPDNAIIPVTSLLEGKLTYKSIITVGLKAEWYHFGDVVDLEFKELKSMMGSQIRFFSEPWISIPTDVVEALNATKYYKNVALTVEEFNNLFKQKPADITATIIGLSASFKNSVRIRAKKMIENGDLDSILVQRAIEKGLGRPLFDEN